VTSFPAPGSDDFDPTGIHEGDVVFVHRFDGASQGYAVNKTSRCASISQLNRALASNGATMPFGGLAAQNNPSGQKPAVTRHELELIIANAEYNAEFGKAVATPEERSKERLNARKGAPTKDQVEQLQEYERDPHNYRWKHASRILSEWTLDGVCCGTEHEHSRDPMVGSSASHPGELLNIAIGGPTAVRNSHGGPSPQQFDEGCRILDKLFVGLVAYETRDENGIGAILHYYYQFKLFTGRQLAWAQLAAEPSNHVEPSGPTRAEFRNMVDVWRVGTIMDTKQGMQGHRCATVNVVVEKWTPQMLREFNVYAGSPYTQMPLPTTLADTTARAMIDAANIILKTTLVPAIDAMDDWLRNHMALGADVADFEHEFEQWQEVDRAWHAADGLAAMEYTALGKRTALPLPTMRSEVSLGPHVFSYAPISNNAAFLWNGLVNGLVAIKGLSAGRPADSPAEKLLIDEGYNVLESELALMTRVARLAEAPHWRQVYSAADIAIIDTCQKMAVKIALIDPVMRVAALIFLNHDPFTWPLS